MEQEKLSTFVAGVCGTFFFFGFLVGIFLREIWIWLFD